jgi:hypothetical protein
VHNYTVDPDFAEFLSVMDETVTPFLRKRKFRQLKRRGIGKNPPKDKVLLYRFRFADTKAHEIQFAAVGAFQPIQQFRINASLIASTNFEGGMGAGFYSVVLTDLLSARSIVGNFNRTGWLVESLLDEQRSSQTNDLVRMLELTAFAWFEEQKI